MLTLKDMNTSLAGFSVVTTAPFRPASDNTTGFLIAFTPVTSAGAEVDYATQTTLAAMSAKLPSSLGAKTAANSLSVAPASDALFKVASYSANQYETVAASQTAQVLGATGAAGDFLAGVLIIPATTGAGSVTLLDGATSIPIFISGTLPSLIPFFVPIGAVSQSGAWKLTTAANVSAIGVGNFT